MDIHYGHDLIFTGSGEGELKAWKIDQEALSHGLRETETGEVCCCRLGLSLHEAQVIFARWLK